jgi:hypothetical protein
MNTTMAYEFVQDTLHALKNWWLTIGHRLLRSDRSDLRVVEGILNIWGHRDVG